MVRNILKLTLFIIISLFFNSCNRIVDGSTLLSGNQKFRSGDYQGAIINYLKGVDSQINRDYFYYNLGNVYSALGESPSAFSVWELTDGGESSQLKFSLEYNKGYLKYQEGNYEEAYSHFRNALQLMPSNLHAKINLELSLNKISAATNNQQSRTTSVPEKIGESDETARILDYVKQKEAMTWGVDYQPRELENDW